MIETFSCIRSEAIPRVSLIGSDWTNAHSRPSDRAFEAIVAPEQFTTRCRESRRAKNAALLRFSGLRAQCGFVGFRSRDRGLRCAPPAASMSPLLSSSARLVFFYL